MARPKSMSWGLLAPRYFILAAFAMGLAVMINIAAYNVSANDNGAFYFDKAPENVFCPQCKCVIDESYVPSSIGSIKSKYPLSYTYDNQPIATEIFRDFCIEHDPSGIDFIQIKTRPNLYLVRPRRVVEFDAEKSRISFERPCAACGQFYEIIRTSENFLKGIEKPLGYGFYRTDLKFSWGKAKCYLVLVGPELRHVMEKQKFKSIYFHPIFGANTGTEEAAAFARCRRK